MQVSERTGRWGGIYPRFWLTIIPLSVTPYFRICLYCSFMYHPHVVMIKRCFYVLRIYKVFSRVTTSRCYHICLSVYYLIASNPFVLSRDALWFNHKYILFFSGWTLNERNKMSSSMICYKSTTGRGWQTCDPRVSRAMEARMASRWFGKLWIWSRVSTWGGCLRRGDLVGMRCVLPSGKRWAGEVFLWCRVIR